MIIYCLYILFGEAVHEKLSSIFLFFSVLEIHPFSKLIVFLFLSFPFLKNIYFAYKFFNMFSKYFLSFCGLSFILLMLSIIVQKF